MNTPESVAACTSCSAVYMPGPGDQGICPDCRRRQAVQPRAIAPRPNTIQPVRSAPMAPTRPAASSAQRPNFAARRALWRIGAAAVLAGGIVAAAVTQRQHISNAWTKLQRHGVSHEWVAIQRKASDLWVAIRRETPWLPWPEGKRNGSAASASSHTPARDATATRGTHRQTQLAERSTKRKGKKQRDDMNGTP